MKCLASVCLALAALAALPLGAASQPAAKPARPAGSACFWPRDVNNFAAVNDEAVYVRVGVSEIYELKLFGNCLDLDWVHHLALASHTGGAICEGTNPDLDIFARETGIGRQRCPVTAVRKLTPAEVSALPKGARP